MNEFAIDKFLTQEQETAIEKLTTASNFPWFFSAGTVLPEDIAENPYIIPLGINPPQFVHQIDLQKCSYIDLIAPVLNTLATEFQTNISVIKIKFNLLTKWGSDQHHFPHTDIDQTDDCFTAIYYVTNTDGPTYLFDQFGPKTSDQLSVKTMIGPQKGKMAVFKADRFHASSSPTESEYRIVLNIVFKVNY